MLESDVGSDRSINIISELRLMMKNRDLMVLSFAVLVSMMGFGLIMPFLPVYAEDFGASDFEIGMMMGVFALVRLVFSPIGGWLADRVGRKPVMVFGMFFYAVVMLLFGLATTIPGLFLYRGLQGGASGLVWPVAMTYVGDVVEDRDRGKAMAIFSIMFATGTAVGPVLGGLISTAYSFSTAFFFTSVLALISGLLILWKVKESFEKDKDLSTEKPPSPRMFALTDITPYPKMFVGISVASFAIFFGNAMIYPVLPIYASSELGLVTWEIGVLFTIMGFVQVIVMFPAGVLADSLGKKKMMLLGMAFAALFSGLVIITQDFVTVLIIVALFTLGRSIARPIFPAVISSLTSMRHRGKAMGLYTLAQNLAFALGSSTSGYLAQGYGRTVPFIAAMCVGLLGLFTVLLFVAEPNKLEEIKD
jgi:DHA1 family multidrug resistance protein-like MFS transporter